MAIAMMLSTIPIAVAGLLVASLIEGPLGGLGVIAVALIVGSAWLWAAKQHHRGHRRAEHLSVREIGAIGLAQAAALVPGVSRSGATIGAGLLLGLTEHGRLHGFVVYRLALAAVIVVILVVR